MFTLLMRLTVKDKNKLLADEGKQQCNYCGTKNIMLTLKDRNGPAADVTKNMTGI